MIEAARLTVILLYFTSSFCAQVAAVANNVGFFKCIFFDDFMCK